MWLCSQGYLKPHERFFIPNYHLYWTDHLLGIKGRTAVAVINAVPHTTVDLTPIISVEATRFCILIVSNEVLLVAVYKSPGHADDEFLSF
jgi:hypothetical protein